MNFREALKQGIGRLRTAGVASPVLAAELLLMHVAGASRAWLYSHIDDSLDSAAADRYGDLIGRRAAGTPTQYLTGHQEFWGLDFDLTPDVLIPRPETEHVVEAALTRIGQQRSREALRVADVGTGSGCIAVALARELPKANVFATDVSLAALRVARRNAERLGVARRVVFAASNLLSAFAPRSFDLVVSNPPYVGRRESSSIAREIREHEPDQAVFGGEEGIEVYPPLMAQAAECLRAGGVLVVELGYGMSERVMALLDAGDWRDVSVTSDLAGIPRVVAAGRR
ncbi:MAG TPA: peptide chain release factor N(5)-glutamine methyltransferase [Candidatus Dormibacteraeota bacterium]|nr:peptide chain release factor N(5)-glutamine methyltransferase [Candidatus Dormibacteraeota bacterium]